MQTMPARRFLSAVGLMFASIGVALAALGAGRLSGHVGPLSPFVVGPIGVLAIAIGAMGPLRVVLSGQRVPVAIGSMLRVLGVGFVVVGLAMGVALVDSPAIGAAGLLVAGLAAGVMGLGGPLRVGRALPDDMSFGELSRHARSAGVFGSSGPSNATQAFERWAPTGGDGVPVGAPVPDGAFETMDGAVSTLAEWLAEDPDAPVVLNLGSYTCPHHRQRIGELHGLFDAWSPKGVRFLTVYVAEAHPEDGWALDDQYVQDPEYGGDPDAFCFFYAKDMADRRGMAQWLIDKKAFRIPVVLDSMEDTLLSAFNAWPIRLYVLHHGRVVYSGEQGPFGYQPAEVGAALSALMAPNADA